MADISKINVDNFEYNVKDIPARESIDNLKEDLNEVNSNIEALQSNFESSISSIFSAIQGKGVTPASKNLNDVIAGINNIKTGKINTFYVRVFFTVYWQDSNGTVRASNVGPNDQQYVDIAFDGSNFGYNIYPSSFTNKRLWWGSAPHYIWFGITGFQVLSQT